MGLPSAAPAASAAAPAARAGPAVVAAIVLLALNLRTVLASLPPLVADVRADLGLAAAAAGLLTTLPVLCLGALAPLPPRLAARFAIERLLVALALATAAGAGLRGAGTTAALVAGGVVVGSAIALAQAIVPVLACVLRGPLVAAADPRGVVGERVLRRAVDGRRPLTRGGGRPAGAVGGDAARARVPRPLLAGRMADQLPLLAATVAAAVAGLAGLLAAPALAPLWVVLIAIALLELVPGRAAARQRTIAG